MGNILVFFTASVNNRHDGSPDLLASLPNQPLDDYEQLGTFSSGTFCRVVLASHRENGEGGLVAIKVMQTDRLMETGQLAGALEECRLLRKVRHPFIAAMHDSFRDRSSLYIVLEFVAGGELLFHLRRLGRFSEPLVRFYAAQMVLALEYLHALNILHRDLKPENLLVHHNGYLKLVDFGFAKQVKGGRTWTCCYTPDYAAPEILLGQGHSLPVDWWSFGAVIYELVAGRTPFFAASLRQTYKHIRQAKPTFPFHFSSSLIDLLRNLLQKDASRRLGRMVNCQSNVRSHRWFDSVPWSAILEQKVFPPSFRTSNSDYAERECPPAEGAEPLFEALYPKLDCPSDTRHFEEPFCDRQEPPATAEEDNNNTFQEFEFSSLF